MLVKPIKEKKNSLCLSNWKFPVHEGPSAILRFLNYDVAHSNRGGKERKQKPTWVNLCFALKKNKHTFHDVVK